MKTIKCWMDERECATDESSDLPQENMDEEVVESYRLSDGSEVAFTATSYVMNHCGGSEAGEDFDDEQPLWAEEIRIARLQQR